MSHFVPQHFIDAIDPNKYYSATQLSKIIHCTRQAIYFAKHKKLLQTKRVHKHYFILGSEFIRYINDRWLRSRTVFKGKPLYSSSELSVNQVAQKLGTIPNHIYYLIYSKQIPFETRKNKAYIFNANLIEQFTLPKLKRIHWNA